MSEFDGVDRLVEGRLDRWTEELVQLCRFPSEADDAAALEGAADWTVERLRALGATVEVVRLDGVPPLVVGEIGNGPRTLNLVQHYDVQPAGALELWTVPPYEPAIRDGRLYARGATDNKGELLSRIWGVEAYLEAIGELPCRVRFLVEGEEESGSEHLDALLDLRPELRRADGALIEGGGVDAIGHPWIDCGVRGMLAVELLARTAGSDIHSGHATLVPNAAVRLVAALATLHDDGGAVIIDRFRDDIRRPSDAAVAHVRSLPTHDLEDLRRAYGVGRLRGGLEGADAMEALAFEPTANIQAIRAGSNGPVWRNVVPAEARARLDIRLVPDQDPERVKAALRAHLDRRGFADVAIEPAHASARPYWTPIDHPIVRAAIAASEAVVGGPATVTPSMAGTAPMWQVCGRDGVPQVTLGGGTLDCMAHAPDENYRLDLAGAAARITARFLDTFAAMPANDA